MPAPTVPVVNPVGAGDALLGATLVAIERGLTLDLAVRHGVAYAAASVAHPVAGYAERALATELAASTARGGRSVSEAAPSRRAPTVSDVAGRAGVSPKTVSRALNNEGNVRPDKVDRVRRAAEELGFQPNQFARLLRTRGTASMVGVVTASVGDPFWTGVLQGVEAVIGGGDRFILSASTRDRSDRESEIVAAMVERRVMALLVVPTAVDQSYLGAIVAGGTPVVCIDRPAVGADIDAVVADDVGGVRRGMDLLIERGHRRIAFLGTGSIYTTGKRVEGYRQALAAAGIASDDALVHAAINEAALVDPAVDALLALVEPPTAVFAANVNTSVGLAVGAASAAVVAGDRRLQRLRRGAHPRPDGHRRRQRPGRARPPRRRAGARTPRRLSRSRATRAHRHPDHRAREPPGGSAMTLTTRPHPLPPNAIEHFYSGGERIADLRGGDHVERAERCGDLRSGWPRR